MVEFSTAKKACERRFSQNEFSRIKNELFRRFYNYITVFTKNQVFFISLPTVESVNLGENDVSKRSREKSKNPWSVFLHP